MRETGIALKGLALSVTVILVLGEYLWSRRLDRQTHDRRETLASLGILVVMMAIKTVLVTIEIALYGAIQSRTPLAVPQTLVGFSLCFLVVDFLTYWYHRWSHELPILWAFHMVHHTSMKMNLTSSFRLNWFAPLVTIPFFGLAVALGFPALFVIASLGLNLFYQLWLHTELIGKMGSIEGWINTPSAHRVHHGSNHEYIDHNYGGVLMIWDRLFGTYAVERQRPTYGVTTGFVSHRPLRLVVQGFVEYRNRPRVDPKADER